MDNDDLMDLSSFALFPQETLDARETLGTSKSPQRRSCRFAINKDDIVPDPTDQV